MNIRSTIHLITAGLALTLGSISAQSVQLRDGSILVGEIQDVDGEGFTLLRTDNGGVLKLRWTHLTASSAKQHRMAFNLLNTKDEEVTVRADVVSYENSTGKILEAVGRIVKKDADYIHVRRGRDVTPIRRSDLRGLSVRQVTPFEIFTREDYYSDLLGKSVPAEDADKHLALGEMLMRVRDYEHAEFHLKKAKTLGGGRQGNLLKERLARLQLLRGAAAEQRLLDEIRTFTNRGSFPLAAERIAQFKQKFPDSKLQSELMRLENNYTKARGNKLARRVASLWYKYISILANTKASDPKTTLAIAKRYGERDMGKAIRERIAQSLQVEAAEIEEFWENRFNIRGAASGQHYHYSIGSWLLGPEAVLEGTTQGKAEAEAAKKEKSAEQKKIDDGLRRIREGLRRSREAQRRRANRAGQDKKKKVTPESWWKKADRNQRTTWLKAYYAENSGDMKVTARHLTPCSNCAGTGRRVMQGSVGQAQQADCPICHRTRFKRDIRAR